MKALLKFSLIVLVLIGTASSCGNTKHSNRKCDGRKGTRTPMGLM